MKSESQTLPDTDLLSTDLFSTDIYLCENHPEFGTELSAAVTVTTQCTKNVSFPPLLKAFYHRSKASPCKKEYIRQRLFRAMQALITLSPSSKSPLYKLFLRSASHRKKFADTVTEYSSQLQQTFKAPKNFAYKGRLCTEKSLNEASWRRFTHTPGVRPLLAILTQFLFCDKSDEELTVGEIPTLAENWGKDCCVGEHSDECVAKWKALMQFVSEECALHGGSIEWWMMLSAGQDGSSKALRI